MAPKQQLKSIEKKMQRIQDRTPEINLAITSKYFYDIERYFKLSREHFYLKFKIEHCETCGKKL